MTVDAMRSAISEWKNASKWKERVKRMPDFQVIAVYKRLERAGELDKAKKHIPASETKPDLERLTVDEEGRLVYCANAW